MQPSWRKVQLAALVFVAWIGFLIYLVATERNATVLSQPQVLTSAQIIIIARLDSSAQDEAIAQAVWKSATAPDKGVPQPGEKVSLRHLKLSKGFKGAGDYVLPLVANADGQTWRVAPMPTSPGQPGIEPPRIYLADTSARRQLREWFPDQ